MKIKSLPVDRKLIKAGPDDGLDDGEFIVYPSTFTREPDAYGDVVAKGAFVDTIKAWEESGNVMSGLYAHDMYGLMNNVAAASELSEDDHGWRVRGKFDLDTQESIKAYNLVKGRRINQLSFAYDVLDEAKITLEDGRKANELRKLHVYEFSFVMLGANQDTSVVAIKSATAELSIKAGRVLSAKNEDALREVRDQISEAVKGLTSVLKSVESAEESDDQEASGQPDAKTDANDEEPEGAKSSAPAEEPKGVPSVDDLATHIQLLALQG